MIHIFTITARNYLSLALTLGDSVRRHHPEAEFTIFVSDGLDDIDFSQLRHRLEDARKAIGSKFDPRLPFKYNITEYCTAIKPALFRHLFERSASVDLIYYMDPDTYLFSRLDPITVPFPDKVLFLAPHLINCRLADDHPYPEYKHLWEGIFNLGFCAFRRGIRSTEIIDWWDARLQDYCYADFNDGLHTDQKWMDYAPVFFGDDLSIIRHYGVNVAHWNILERLLKWKDDAFWVQDQALIFFHFSGFDFKGASLTKHVPVKLQRYIDDDVLKLSNEYRNAVFKNGYDQFIKIPYRYASYSDGAPVSQQHRRLFRSVASDNDFSDPFDCDGPFRLQINKHGLLDKSDAASGNYSASTLKNLSSTNFKAQSVLKFLLRVVGPRRYAYLIKFFARYGRVESHSFLLKDFH